MNWENLTLDKSCYLWHTAMSLIPLRLYESSEFKNWMRMLDGWIYDRVRSRLDHLEEGHPGDSRSLGGGLFELKWRNGMRVYYTLKRIGNIDSIILYGGFKGTQHGDIEKARALRIKYEGGSLDRRATP